MTFSLVNSISIDLDGNMQVSQVQSPAILGNRIRVSVPQSIEATQAAKLLRRIADELEAR